MDYYTYIKSPEWITKKQEVKDRIKKANGCLLCLACGSKDTELHVHYRFYERLGNERGGDLVLLCKNCHQEIHDRVKNVRGATLRASTAKIINSKRRKLGISSRNNKLVLL